MTTLTDRIVFISGASSGIGAACAEIFAAQGCHLILAARRLTKIAALASKLKQQHNIKTHCIALDVRSHHAVTTAIAALAPAWQAISILINNAGLAAGLDFIQDAELSDCEQMIDTNIKGLLYVSKAIMPLLLQQDHARIINIGSIAGHEVYPKGAVYCATKHAVNALNQGMRIDLLGTQVGVSSVDPGMVETEFSLVRFKGDQTRSDSVYAGLTPLHARDVAETVLFCATRPAHVNINDIIVMPSAQASATLNHRDNTPNSV